MSAALSDSRRRPKGDKRQRTRARLVEACAALIREKGYDATTLADVAQRAGVTTGAIYGNFKNREDLFMAVADLRGAPIVADVRPGMTFAEVMRATAEAVIAAIPQRRAAAVGMLGFHSYTLRHEEVRARVLESTKRSYRAFEDGVRALLPPEQRPIPVELLIPMVGALIDGLLLQRHLTPELITDQVILDAFDTLARVSPRERST